MRHNEPDGHKGEREQQRNNEVSDSPSGDLPEEGDGGHTDDVGNGESREHQCDALPPLTRAHQIGGHQRRDAEVGAVRQTCHKPGEKHQAEGGQQCGRDRSHREGDEQHQQKLFAGEACGEGRDGRGTDHHPQGVGRDEQAGARRRFFLRRGPEGGQQVLREVGQQAHGHKLGGADGKTAERECEEGEACAAGGQSMRGQYGRSLRNRSSQGRAVLCLGSDADVG